jgi:hypothetical protein
MATWLGMPNAISDHDDLVGLVAALEPKGTALNLDAVLRFRQPLGSSGNGVTLSQSLLRSAGGSASALAVLSDPAGLLSPDSQDPVAQWLAPVLKDTLQTLGSEGLRLWWGWIRAHCFGSRAKRVGCWEQPMLRLVWRPWIRSSRPRGLCARSCLLMVQRLRCGPG